MKPYRLINTSELHNLEQYFQTIIHEWNKNYCLNELEVELKPISTDYHCEATYLIPNYALLESNYLNTIKHALFMHDNEVFSSASEELFLILLNQLFKIDNCQLQRIHATPTWFYKGSTSLLLTFNCDSFTFTLILSPDWVYQQLPKLVKAHNKPIDVEEALTEHRLNLSAELIPSNLSIKEIAQIQIGDVLTTKHLLTTPLRLMHQQVAYAEAELGQTAAHKSIILKRSI